MFHYMQFKIKLLLTKKTHTFWWNLISGYTHMPYRYHWPESECNSKSHFILVMTTNQCYLHIFKNIFIIKRWMLISNKFSLVSFRCVQGLYSFKLNSSIPWLSMTFVSFPCSLLSSCSQNTMKTIYYSRYFPTLWCIECKLVLFF